MEKQDVSIGTAELSYYSSGQPSEYASLVEAKNEEVVSVFYLNLHYDGKIYLPISIFSSKLTPLRAIVKYLRENLSKTNQQVSALLNRDPQTVWATYNSAKKARLEVGDDSSIKVPVEIFSDERLSAFEALVSYLRGLEMRLSEIARLLGKNPRTIWTIEDRARIKIKTQQNEKA